MQDQPTVAKETTVSVAPMHFILTSKYLENRDIRSHNICVSSDRLDFFLSLPDIFVFESYALFGDRNKNIKCKNCPISTHSAKN